MNKAFSSITSLSSRLLLIALAAGVSLPALAEQAEPDKGSFWQRGTWLGGNYELATLGADRSQSLVDPDADGVIDAREACVETQLGARVDNTGCNDMTLVVEELDFEIRFDNDSTVIKPKWHQELAELAGYLRESPNIQITLQGHASQVGDAEHNRQLSVDRATAVREYLASRHGIALERLNLVGYGEGAPLVTGDDESAHRYNRRVSAYIFKQQDAVEMKWEIYGMGRTGSQSR